MNLVVLAPHRDPTIAPEVEGAHVLLDPARDFVVRLLEPDTQDRLESRLLGAVGEPGAPEGLLQVRAARQVLSRGPVDPRASLCALGALLSASAVGTGVRLRLDDLELAAGSTERSGDVLAALAAGDAPYQPELEALIDGLPDAGRIRFWLEQDQQLMATLSVAAAARARGLSVELAGPFARMHFDVLAGLPAFEGATLAQPAEASSSGARGEGLGLRWRIRWPGGLAGPGEGLCWRTEDGPRPEGQPWGGYLHAADLAEPAALLASGLRVGVLRMCALDDAGPGRVLLLDGRWMDVAQALLPLQRAGVALRAEWLVGAPGVDAEALEATWARWATVMPDVPCIGVRQFHWNRSRAGNEFAGQPVALAPRPDRDLARSLAFEAPRTLSAEALGTRLAGWALRAAEAGSRAPGRVAAGALLAAEPEGTGPGLALARACAVVTLPLRLDGQAGPVAYAAHLGTGSLLALDARLAPTLAACVAPSATEVALARLPAAARERLVPALVSKGILVRS